MIAPHGDRVLADHYSLGIASSCTLCTGDHYSFFCVRNKYTLFGCWKLGMECILFNSLILKSYVLHSDLCLVPHCHSLYLSGGNCSSAQAQTVWAPCRFFGYQWTAKLKPLNETLKPLSMQMKCSNIFYFSFSFLTCISQVRNSHRVSHALFFFSSFAVVQLFLFTLLLHYNYN